MEPPHVPGPNPGCPVAQPLARVVGKDVVDDHQSGRRHPALHIHKISQGELEQVHTVDEHEINGLFQHGRSLGLEEPVAGRGDNAVVGASGLSSSGAGSTPIAGQAARARLQPWRTPISR